jgi:hypothetical protein
LIRMFFTTGSFLSVAIPATRNVLQQNRFARAFACSSVSQSPLLVMYNSGLFGSVYSQPPAGA